MRVAVKILVLLCLLGPALWPANAAATRYRWKKNVISISLSTSLTANKTNLATGSTILTAVENSVSSWGHVADVNLILSASGDQNVSPSGVQGDGVSLITIAATPENLAMFPRGLEDAAALTRVFYNSSGMITEADIVLNPYLQFSTNGTFGTFDLESTITHEIGHLLGLGHSPVLSATMSENYGRNGSYGLPAINWRTLAADDIAAIRSLYGPKDGENDCCGRISGRLTSASGKAATGITVWAEDISDGRVLAANVSTSDGTFRLDGLSNGKVRLICQDDRDARNSTAYTIGEYQVNSGSSVNAGERVYLQPSNFIASYLGFNGQLSALAVPVNSGAAYNILVGGTSLGATLATAGTASSGISVSRLPGKMDFGDGLDAIGFEIEIDPETSLGEYSLYVENGPGFRRYFIGGLAVEKQRNFWSIRSVK